MKRFLLGIAFFVAHEYCVQAQVLYATTPEGGDDGGGTIHHFTAGTTTIIVDKSFESNAAFPQPTNILIRGSDGKLYGVTSGGGKYEAGVIYSFDPVSLVYTKLWNFDKINGERPLGSLVQASDGKLYGMTFQGGNQNAGIIFSFDVSSLTFSKLKDFNESDGAEPFGKLIQASDGKLYGLTTTGGNIDLGVMFAFDPATFTYTKLLDFNNINGNMTAGTGSLVQGADGLLYGTTPAGGASDAGVLFSFNTESYVYANLKDFDNASGIRPSHSLLMAKDGKLYGVTEGGGSNGYGVLYSFDPVLSVYTKRIEFGYGNRRPHSVMQAGNGKLYIATLGLSGTIFSFDPATSGYALLKEFSRYPSGVVQASNGKLYGMAMEGIDSRGIIFSIDPASSLYTQVLDLAVNEEGNNPSGSLVRAGNGKLYSTTSEGGKMGYGVLFSFDPVSSTYIKLTDFDKTNGANPRSGLIQASDGKLYGVTENGGVTGQGVLFSFDPVFSVYTKLKDFNNTSGFDPTGGLLEASDGKLYGMTYSGGSRGPGVLFSFDPSTSSYQKLKEFGINGRPAGNLIQAGNGNLYGMTYTGGNNNLGTIFTFNPSTSTFTKLKEFLFTDGVNPYGSLVQASNGNLYGMTSSVGNFGKGTIFSFEPVYTIFTKLKDFDNTNGSKPLGSLMQASDGRLYGATSLGGSSNLGVIFSFDPATSVYTKIKDYTGENGANPSENSAFTEVPAENLPPVVIITDPANNATYVAPASPYLRAEASDADGSISKVEFYNGTTLLRTETVFPYAFTLHNLAAGSYTLTAKATDNSGLVTASAEVHISVIANTAPTVSIINPANNQTFLKGATVHLEAAAADADDSISKVEFYNGSTLLATERKPPYTFDWPKVQTGSYTITARATDSRGAVSTSSPVKFSVVPNTAPSVSIISPANGATFSAPATVNLQAVAQDPDGRITKVEFYNGSTLLATERKPPYGYAWQNVAEGNYVVKAVATDNWGAATTAAPVAFSVTSAGGSLVSGRASVIQNEELFSPMSIRLLPNPAKNIINISLTGLAGKQTALSVISASGAVIKVKRLASPPGTLQLDISSLSKGIYTLKIVNGDKSLYRKFVKI